MSAKPIWIWSVCVAVALSGCAAKSADKPIAANIKAEAQSDSNHDGWWCDEHGVPEEVCALCNVKLVADFKAKVDWCKEHERPDSQCFVCHPEKEGEFAAQYEAKYGEQPPKPQSEPEIPAAGK